MPVSKISRVGVRSSTFGAGRWIGQRSSVSTSPFSSIGWPSRLKMRPSVAVADRHGDRAAGVAHLDAARQAVGRVHGDRADAVVAEVLLHLEHERGVLALAHEVDLERVVDLGQVVGGEGDLDDDALDLLHGADGGCLGCLGCGFHSSSLI